MNRERDWKRILLGVNRAVLERVLMAAMVTTVCFVGAVVLRQWGAAVFFALVAAGSWYYLRRASR